MEADVTGGDSTYDGKGLTHGQTQIWVGQRLNPESPLYNMTFAWVLPVELDPELLQQAWQRVVDASDALRTVVVERDGVVQGRLLPRGSCGTRRLGTEVLNGLDSAAGVPAAVDPAAGDPAAGDPVAAFRRWCQQRAARPLKLEKALIDSLLVDLGDGRTGWYLNQHHLITDAWSTVLLYRQVAAEYESLGTAGDPPAETPRPEPLADYDATMAEVTSRGGDRTAADRHWQERFARPEPILPLYGRSGQPEGTASRRWTLELDAERSRALERLCGETGFLSLSPEMSRFALFATLLSSWLHHLSGRLDLSFDAPVAGRPTAQAKRSLGLFIEMFPFAVRLDADETFRSLAAKCLAEAGLFLGHSQPGTSAPSGAVASNVVLNYFPPGFGDFAGLPTEVEWVHPGHGDRVHALRLQVHDFAARGRLTLHFDINREVLPETLCRRSLLHFEILLEALLKDPDGQIAAVDVLTGEERQTLERLHGRGGGAALPPLPQPLPLPPCTVVDLFLARAETDAERTVLRQGEREMTFRQLQDASGALAAALLARGVLPGERVAILAKRSIEAVVAILGTLRAGAAYVPLDVAYPQRRRQRILRDCGAGWVLVGEGLRVDADDAEPGGPQALSIAEAMMGPAGRHPEGRLPENCLPKNRLPEIRHAENHHPGLGDLAYVLYTSGSTGRPKGVLIEHRGVADYLTWASRRYVRGDRLRFPLFTSLAFDLTVTSLFLPLITGGVLEIYPEPEGSIDAALIDVVTANTVDFIKLTPSHLTLLRQMAPEQSHIRRLVVGGEALPTQLAAEVAELLGEGVEIHNEYGPTEAVVGCVVHRFVAHRDGGVSGDHGPGVLIGRPADHVRVEVLNHALAPVPLGVPGELWIRRHGLAWGYSGLPALTAERFQLSPQGDGRRRYRSGDLVRLVEGDVADSRAEPLGLQYLGRLDRQLKISGFRVEPAEIEGALLTFPGVEQCAVVARRAKAQVSSAPGKGAEGAVPYCQRCGLSSNHPRATLDRQGVCSICRAYETAKVHAEGYFKTLPELQELFAEAVSRRGEAEGYDCMLLFSGGKDSTYALCRLVDMGLKVYAFTLDNGFISEGAKDNIRRVTEHLGVPAEMASTPAMPAIFRDSLRRFANVCQGCFKTIYTLATQRAKKLGIPIVVTGLSRGQMFETRLNEEMFRDGRRRPEEVDAAMLAARKVYHRLDDEVSRSLDVEIFQDDAIFDQIRFVDFYRYLDVGLSEVLAYLQRKVPWVRPEDTGRSTNCLINDVGIYVHQQQRGYHNYALPYSWDVRLGHKTLQEARSELEDSIDVERVRHILAEIGCQPEAMMTGTSGGPLVAYYVADGEVSDQALRRHLRQHLPAALVPTHLRRLPSLPLTVQGKVDASALPAIELEGFAERPYRMPEGPVEAFLAEVWQELLAVPRVGADDSFFELGGTSLAAMEVMIRLGREFAIDLPLETLFAHRALGDLARVAEDRILADVEGLSDEEQQALLVGEGDPMAAI